MQRRFIPRQGLEPLIRQTLDAGYRLHAPQSTDGAILYRPIHHSGQLPWGLHDHQAPGHYRLLDNGSPRAFAWATGPQALKPLLFRPSEPIWTLDLDSDGRPSFIGAAHTEAPLALLGLRPCDLAALALQDAHFLHGPYPDPAYAARRRGLLTIAVNCSHPAATCFCAATGDGPNAQGGYDLLLDELDDGYLIESGSAVGKTLLDRLDTLPATDMQLEAMATQRASAVRAQQRKLPNAEQLARLPAQHDHPHWAEVAERCLACGNCTAVCPTCFCHAHRETPALDGQSSVHSREWDSCFTSGHSYLHGHVVHTTTRERYRQWLTHKLAGWVEQYGRSGCVGCGRCITWCPVGIDLTVESAALVDANPAQGE